MSQSQAQDLVRNDGLSNSSDFIQAREDDLSSETKETIIANAKDVIAGRVLPPALIAAPEVEKFLQLQFKDSEPPPTVEARQRVMDRLSLQAHYGGRPVACYLTIEGRLAVLAAGDREIEALLGGLSEEEGAKVVVTDTEQF